MNDFDDISFPTNGTQIENEYKTRKDSFKEWWYYFRVNILQAAIVFDKQFRVGQMFDIVMRMNETSDRNIRWFHLTIEIIGVPLLTSFISLFVGAISDYWPGRKGRRTSMMLWALIPYLIGCYFFISSGIYPCVFFWDNEIRSRDDVFFKIGITSYCVGYVFWGIGVNLISVMFRSYILDEFDTTQQDKVNLVKSFMTGVGYVLSYGIFFVFSLFTFNWNSSNDTSTINNTSDSMNELFQEDITLLKRGGSVITMIFAFFSCFFEVAGVFYFIHVTKEQKYIASELTDQPRTKKECIKQSPKNVLSGFKAINYGIFGIFIVVFFGWIDWGSFIDNFLGMNRNFLYPGRDNVDLRFLIFEFNFTFIGILIMIESIVLYVTKWRLDKFTTISFFICALTTVMLYFIQPSTETTEIMWFNYLHASIPFFCATLILTALKSFPYSLMRDTVPEDKHGVIMGIMNIFINIGQSTAFLIDIVLEASHNNVTKEEDEKDHPINSYIFINALCIMSTVVSVIFRFIRKSSRNDGFEELKQNLNDSKELFDDIDN